MSRVGKKPISIPSSVQVSVEGSKIVFKGGKLTKELETYGRVGIAFKEGELTFSLNGDSAQAKAYSHGRSWRSLPLRSSKRASII